MQQLVPIEMLTSGEQARVIDVQGQQDAVLRLNELGLRAGSFVRMLQSGMPCIIAIDQRRLSFRGDRSACVLVEPC